MVISMQYKAPLQTLDKSASSNSLANKSNRNFLVFCAFLLTLLLGSSSLQRASPYLPSYDDLRGYAKESTMRRFFSRGAVLQVRTLDGLHAPAIRDEAFYCNRSHHRTDVCVVKGDVRVVGGGGHGGGYKVLLLAEAGNERVEKVRPYTRKWEKNVMTTIDEVTLIKKVCNMISRRSMIRNGVSIRSSDRGIGAALQYPPADDHWHSNLQQKVQEMPQISPIFKQKKALRLMELQQKGRSSTRKGKIKKIDPQSRMNLQQTLQPLQQEVRSIARPDQSVTAVTLGDASSLQKKCRSGSHQLIPNCEVQHEVPGILFSTGGYTGNVYHEFNDGLIPLFITAQQYPRGQVVLIVLEYHEWWMSKYAEVVAQISNYAVIDLARDKRVHCFPEITVGLRIHDELAIHAADHASMKGFQSMLRAAYLPGLQRRKAKIAHQALGPAPHPSLAAISKKRPKLVIISRRSPRAILNQKQVITLAEKVGFSVQVLSPTQSTSMVKAYRVLSACDVMMGVHGAGMTHLLFMRPGATFIQVVPLGTDWAAATYYGEPAEKLGLKYVEYKVSRRESSLSEKYGSEDPVLVNPEAVNRKGWWETKRIYLEGQDVRISLAKMAAVLRSVYDRLSSLEITPAAPTWEHALSKPAKNGPRVRTGP